MTIKKYLNRLLVHNNFYIKIPSPSPSSFTSFSFSDDDDSANKIRRHNNNNKASSFRRRSSSHTPSSRGGSGENPTTENAGDNGAYRYSSSSTSSSPPQPLHSSSILSELQRAFVYFEIETTITGEETLTALTRGSVRKKYKRMSLIHHPDRNSNGEKSIREMQTINHYYSILEEEIDRREEEFDDNDNEEENIDGEHNNRYRNNNNHNNNSTRSSRRSFRRRSHSRHRSTSKKEEEDIDGELNRDRDNNNNNSNTRRSRRSFRRRSTSRRPNSNTNDGMEDPNCDSSRQPRWRQQKQQQQHQRDKEEEPKKQPRRRRRNSTERRQRKTEHEKERQSMEEEMKNEWNDNRRKMNVFQKKQRKLRRKNTRQSIKEQLDTVWGRDQAFETYTKRIRVYRNELANSSGTPTSLQEKIKYPIMDCCNEDVVVAMRLKQTGVAVEIIHQKINNTSERWLRLKMRTSTTTTVNKYAGVYQSTSKRGFSVNVDQGYYKRILDVLINPIDEERSSILHYAVYLEDHEMISYLAQVAKRYHCYAKVVTYTNTRGMNASQFTAGCTGDSVPALMTTLTKEAKFILEERRQRTIKNQQRPVGNIFAHPYADPLFCVFLCLIVGRYVTCSGWITSSVIIGLSHLIHLIESDQATIVSKAYFFTLHIGWYLLREIFFRGWNLVDSIDKTFSVAWQLQVVGLVIIPFIVKLRYDWSFHLLVQIESSLIFCLNWILSKNATMFTGYAKHLIDFTILSIPFLVVQQSY
ncbi:hypothetical protein FRACYDRAFT_239659 [Fragilariopsis cylindrus CCMP1102]|uniref:J domain-containing protein n=1 Tax=Fragilariopsis cylindrus CCMP1102 TaxID=635003 RepID=A0A1E7FFY8_9STRA|nr:hypothetical protein FRACYDRAFT_239659 [Fragilariopsis cylindrus CCMP1102]|eukprot:OEU17056.1 hypothetical protein FRACYDRAFT_239659 [Fragilariopsis cylindrus CCMP1102]